MNDFTEENSNGKKSHLKIPIEFYSVYIFFDVYLFYLTTTSGRPEPECTLRRVMSSEPIQDQQLTRDCKQTTNNLQ